MPTLESLVREAQEARARLVAEEEQLRAEEEHHARVQARAEFWGILQRDMPRISSALLQAGGSIVILRDEPMYYYSQSPAALLLPYASREFLLIYVGEGEEPFYSLHIRSNPNGVGIEPHGDGRTVDSPLLLALGDFTGHAEPAQATEAAQEAPDGRELETVYRFTRDQLRRALEGAIEMAREYEENHGYGRDQAQIRGAAEILEGLRAEIEIHTHEGRPYTAQLDPGRVICE